MKNVGAKVSDDEQTAIAAESPERIGEANPHQICRIRPVRFENDSGLVDNRPHCGHEVVHEPERFPEVVVHQLPAHRIEHQVACRVKRERGEVGVQMLGIRSEQKSHGVIE